MICPQCRIELPVESKFCFACGSKIDLICPECGKIVPPGSKFCLYCGHDLCQPVSPKDVPKNDYQQPQSYTPKLLADKILTTRSVIEGERKIVTVMFIDVAGFSTLSEKLDPEDVHAVMDGCFRILLNHVHACEGTVNEFRGDGVMALFGAPITHEDHAQRACYAALAIQHALIPYSRKLKQDYGIDFKMRIGLNSGPVVVGAIGDGQRMDYTAQGDTANLASRMESSAQPGTVLVAEATYRLVGDAFEFEPLGKIPVKGKEKQVVVYRLKDKAFKARARSEREVYSEMVGRDHELARLELRILNALNGEGSVVNVVGEAGIGKSRLLAELKKCEVVKQVILLEGRAISMGKNLSFYPVIDLLKNWARIREDDGEATAMTKLQEAIQRVSEEAANEIFPFLATLMGMKLSGKYAERVKGIEGEALEKLIFKNVRELLIRSTEMVPTVIVFEDLHWADSSSLLLIDALYRLAQSQKVVFINVFRPDYWDSADKNPGNLKERMTNLSIEEVVLQPLDSESSETLINNMLNIKGLQHGVKTQIIERAGGNPLFIEEVVRGVIDEGAVVVKDGGFEVTEKIHSLVIPPTINDVVMARIDRLDEESRNVVKVASVIGRSFFYRILKDVINSVEGLDDKLKYLEQIQLIRERIQMNELEYLFKHALVQEAAYESTLLQHRKQLHLKVAESIERLFSERLHEFYGILALHYSLAGSLEKAEEWLIKAGKEAMRSSASSEALHFYREALSLYLEKHDKAADLEKVALLEINIALAYHYRGKYNESSEYFYRAFDNYQINIPRYNIKNIHKILLNWAFFIDAVYLPFGQSKNNPTEKDEIICKAFLYNGMNMALINPRAFLLTLFPLGLRWLRRFDPRKLEYGVIFCCGCACSLPWAGFFKMGNRLIKLIKDKVDFSNPVQRLYYETAKWHANFSSGSDWIQGEQNSRLTEELIDRNVNQGQLWWVAMILQYYGWMTIEQGNFRESSKIVDKLEKYGFQFNHPHLDVTKHLTAARLNFKRRMLPEAIRDADQGIEAARLTDVAQLLLSLLSIKSQALVLLRETEEAAYTLDLAHQIITQIEIIPYHLGDLFKSQALIDMDRLKQSKNEGKRIDRQAAKWIKRCLKNAEKAACHLTGALKMKGQFYWLIGKQRNALQWYDKSIHAGERLGARPDLSRTYMEVGKRLLQPQSKFKELNGISGLEYLKKAETLFREMDLQWDLEQLEQITVGQLDKMNQ
jgi:class 3 adenylate cyclase/tetratricopeptide (TPR) repeat protein